MEGKRGGGVREGSQRVLGPFVVRYRYKSYKLFCKNAQIRKIYMTYIFSSDGHFLPRIAASGLMHKNSDGINLITLKIVEIPSSRKALSLPLKNS